MPANLDHSAESFFSVLRPHGTKGGVGGRFRKTPRGNKTSGRAIKAAAEDESSLPLEIVGIPLVLRAAIFQLSTAMTQGK